MALAESIEYDKIEVVGIYKAVQVRKATVIKKDDKELTRSFERYVLQPGLLNDSDELVDTDLSGEPAEVSAICTAAWTTEVKAAYKAKLIADKAAGDSVTEIGIAKTEYETDDEFKDRIKRNVEHLEIIKAYKKQMKQLLSGVQNLLQLLMQQ